MPGKKLTWMDRMEANDECGTMNDELKASCLPFIIPHSSFITSPHPVHPC
jgi:hypothetical protein